MFDVIINDVVSNQMSQFDVIINNVVSNQTSQFNCSNRIFFSIPIWYFIFSLKVFYYHKSIMS